MARGTTWYVVADGGKARILVRDGHGMHTLQAIDGAEANGAPLDLSHGASQNKASRSEPLEVLKTQFARLVAERLNRAVQAGEVDEIVLAAAPHVLHDIREGLDKAAHGRLGKALSKDLTNTPDAEMASHFA